VEQLPEDARSLLLDLWDVVRRARALDGIDRHAIVAALIRAFCRSNALRKMDRDNEGALLPRPSATLRRKSLRKVLRMTEALRAELESSPAEVDLFMQGNDERGNTFLASRRDLRRLDEIANRALIAMDAHGDHRQRDFAAWDLVSETGGVFWRFNLAALDENEKLYVLDQGKELFAEVLQLLLPAIGSTIDVDTAIRAVNSGRFRSFAVS
jgi:hypothetical protein